MKGISNLRGFLSPSFGIRAKLHASAEVLRLMFLVGRPRVVLWFNGGLGDHLMCTAVARELRKRGESGIWMLSPFDDLFIRNPDFDAILPNTMKAMQAARILNAKVIEPRYAPDVPGEDRQSPPECHIIAKMCKLVGIKGKVDLRPYLTLTDAEHAAGKMFKRQVCIQSSNVGGLWPASTKQWYPARFQEVVDKLKNDFNFVQLGSPKDPLLNGAFDLRGKTSARQSAAILANSLVFVGLEGFLMHLARAVEARSVIIYGGRVRPSEIGYTANENIYVPMACSPCWRYNSCEFERECMNRIEASDVTQAVFRAVDRPNSKLPTDVAEI